MSKTVLGIDLGGTKFKVGRVENGTVVADAIYKVDNTLGESELLNGLYTTIDAVITPEVQSIGAGVPGIVDPVAGMIYDIQNLPAWKAVPLQQMLEDRYQVPVCLNNDANCFAQGENKFGKGRAYEHFVGLSIGTGLGLGVIIHNRLYSGVMCGAGEIGVLPYKDSIIEKYAGSFFFTSHYQKNAKTMHELALQGNPEALKAFEEFGGHLGVAMKIILYLYAPQAIILGGSISKAFSFFGPQMEKTIATFDYPKQLEKLQIEISTHSNLPVLGAAALCFDSE